MPWHAYVNTTITQIATTKTVFKLRVLAVKRVIWRILVYQCSCPHTSLSFHEVPFSSHAISITVTSCAFDGRLKSAKVGRRSNCSLCRRMESVANCGTPFTVRRIGVANRWWRQTMDATPDIVGRKKCIHRSKACSTCYLQLILNRCSSRKSSVLDKCDYLHQ